VICTDNIVYQEEQDSFELLLQMSSAQGTSSPCRFVHLLNVYAKKGRKTLDQEQTQVLESLREAQQVYARQGGQVSFVAACEESERQLVPAEFAVKTCIRRRANELPEFRSLPPLPFLFDVLAAARAETTKPHEFVVYTNFDIVVQPFFFQFLDYFIGRGFDALIVTRRTVDAVSLEAPLFIAQSDVGKPHPGMDCFVFPREWLESFTTNTAITGAGLVMRSLLYNLVAKAQRLLFLCSAHLTLHYGDDRPWQAPEFKAAEAHNAHEAKKLWQRLAAGQAGRFEDLARKIPRLAPQATA
jgi:hypothetical protein